MYFLVGTTGTNIVLVQGTCWYDRTKNFFATFIFGGSPIFPCLWGNQLVLCFYIEQV